MAPTPPSDSPGCQHCALLPALTLKTKLRQVFLHLAVKVSERNTVGENKPSLPLVPL